MVCPGWRPGLSRARAGARACPRFVPVSGSASDSWRSPSPVSPRPARALARRGLPGGALGRALSRGALARGGLRGRRLGRGLELLLVGADAGQRVVVGDVRDRAVGAGLTERPGRLPPARRLDPQLLAEQGHEDLGLLRAEPGQLGDPLAQVRSVGGVAPDPRGVAVVPGHDQLAQRLDAGGHRLRVAVQRGPFGEHRGERLRVVGGQLLGGRLVPQPPDQVVGRAEGPLQRHLLIQQHADEQGQRVPAEQLVCVRFDRHRDRHKVLHVARTHHCVSS